MSCHPIARWGQIGAVLALAAGLCSGAGCKDLPPQTLGQRCGGEWGPCKKGLRCSYKKKRCYKPVDCGKLHRRLKACLPDVVALYAPSLKTLPAQKRAQLLERIDHHLKTEMVDHCRFDAARYQKKHGTKPTKTKSYGEDRDGKQLTACLDDPNCKTFASCLLGVSRIKGPKRPSAKNPAVFPIDPPRPAPTPAPDAGVAPTGKEPPKADADPKPPKAPRVPKMEAPPMRAAPMGRPAARPKPAAMPRPAMPRMRPL